MHIRRTVLASALATVLSLALASAAGYLYTALLFEAPSVAGWTGMSALLLLSLMAYAALTFVGSTLTRSALAAAAIGIGGMILLAIVAAVPKIAPYTPAGISGAPARALALGSEAGPLIGPLLVNGGLVVALAALAWLAFRRQEL